MELLSALRASEHVKTSATTPSATTIMGFGDQATALMLESRRSIATDTLFKYNDSLVRSIIREQRDLEKLILQVPDEPSPAPQVLIYQVAIARNKRCLLAYHAHRLDFLKDLYWSAGCSIPHILSNADLRSRMSPHEVDWLKLYNESIILYRSEFSNELDITASVERPPKDLHVLVKVVRDCGVVQTEVGSIDFKKGHRFMVQRTDIEHLITQGYLEEV
jgi:GINS complex subunit 1